MTGLFKQQLIAQRTAEREQYTRKIMGQLQAGGVNIAQEGILDTIKNMFIDKGADDKQMKKLAQNSKELEGKVNALLEAITHKKGLPAKVAPIRLKENSRWLTLNDKAIAPDKMLGAVQDIGNVVDAMLTSYLPALNKATGAMIEKYLKPMFHDQFEKELDLNKTLGWQEGDAIYRLMTEKGPTHQHTGLPTIQTKNMAGTWCIRGLGEPMKPYNVRFMHVEYPRTVVTRPIEIPCLTKEQCIAVLRVIGQAMKLINDTCINGQWFGSNEKPALDALKKAEACVPDEGSPDYGAACRVMGLAYTVICRFETVYDTDVYATTALRAIYKICEISVTRME